MGYSSLSDFYRDWADTLQMQMDVYGKIKEKYPKLLPVYHNKLVRYKRNDKYYNHKEYQQAFEEKAAELQKYAYTPTKCDYMFVVPQTALAAVDEANQQSNCLVSAKYMDRVIDGTSVLVFMRPKNAPDTSCVTIEICGDKINQAYQASNRAPTNSQRNAIQKYAEHFDLRYCD